MRVSIVRVLTAAGIASAAVFASCTGDTGPTGPQGDTGPQGPQGDTGPPGPLGNRAYASFASTITQNLTGVGNPAAVALTVSDPWNSGAALNAAIKDLRPLSQAAE